MRASLHGSPLAQFKFDKANAAIALFGARRSFRDLIAYFFAYVTIHGVVHKVEVVYNMK
jgi:hypothetical protein